MAWSERDRGDPFARTVGALLVTEGSLLAATRLLTLVYVIARDAYASDSARASKTVYLTFALASILLASILCGAGFQLRRTPAGAWGGARLVGRINLALAGILNVAFAIWAGTKLSAGPDGAEAVAAWLIMVAVALAVVAGLVRDAAGRARPTVER